MSRPSTKTRVYKESTAQQLRSFCETARLGSFSAAAAHLGLANPTVWHQVRALEKEFGEVLVESYGRGCRLTEAGKTLADLASPLVASLASMKRHFHEARAHQAARLVVATTPRILTEDLPDCVAEYLRKYPDVRLTLKELFDEQVHAHVEAGLADVGIVQNRNSDLLVPWDISPWLEYEPQYELDVLLITPKDHPLARRRTIRLRDLGAYPLVNAPNALPDATTMSMLERAGVLEAQPHLVEAYFTASIRRYVEAGLGIGLVAVPLNHHPSRILHERNLSRIVGRPQVFQLKRKSVQLPRAAVAFMEIVKSKLNMAPRDARMHRKVKI